MKESDAQSLKMIIVADFSRAGSKVSKNLLATGWLKRIEALNCPILVFKGGELSSSLPWMPVQSWAEAVSFAKESNADTIAHIHADQLFFDPQIAKSGLAAAEDGWDYFTQFEHCLLPVGVGLRAFSVSHPEISGWTGTPDELIRHITAYPDRFAIHIDSDPYVDREFSLLDSRVGENSPDFIKKTTGPADFNLSGFLKLARNGIRPKLAYSAKSGARFLDERKMAAPYGFESPECADFPTYIMFDITNVCNSKCVHCPHSAISAVNRAEPKFLDLGLYKKVIDECRGLALQFVRITADGEPLLHPGLTEMIAYAKKAGVGPVGLTSNGSLMTKDMAERILDAGLFMVDFSLDAVNPETYKKIRRGLPFDKVVKNIETFIALKEKGGFDTKVMVSFVKQADNRGETEAFTRRWEPLVDKVLIRELLSNINLTPVSGTGEETKIRRWPCPHFFRRMVISYDGMIKSCPIDWENKTVFMSVAKTSIKDAWHGNFYRKHRMAHLNNRFPEEMVCSGCTDWMGSPWSLGYEKVIGAIQSQ